MRKEFLCQQYNCQRNLFLVIICICKTIKEGYPYQSYFLKSFFLVPIKFCSQKKILIFTLSGRIYLTMRRISLRGLKNEKKNILSSEVQEELICIYLQVKTFIYQVILKIIYLQVKYPSLDVRLHSRSLATSA